MLFDFFKNSAKPQPKLMSEKMANHIDPANAYLAQSFKSLVSLALGMHPDKVLPILDATMKQGQELSEIQAEMRLLERAGFKDCNSYRRLEKMARSIHGEDGPGSLIDSFFDVNQIVIGDKTLSFDGKYFRWQWREMTEEEYKIFLMSREAPNAHK